MDGWLAIAASNSFFLLRFLIIYQAADPTKASKITTPTIIPATAPVPICEELSAGTGDTVEVLDAAAVVPEVVALELLLVVALEVEVEDTDVVAPRIDECAVNMASNALGAGADQVSLVGFAQFTTKSMT